MEEKLGIVMYNNNMYHLDHMKPEELKELLDLINKEDEELIKKALLLSEV